MSSAGEGVLPGKAIQGIPIGPSHVLGHITDSLTRCSLLSIIRVGHRLITHKSVKGL